MRSDIARSTFGVNGSGINVGVLSDSFNCLGGAAGDTANGDLPSVTVIQEISICTGATDEGRAMLQIVHDVAPGANLSFRIRVQWPGRVRLEHPCACVSRCESHR